jgi:hypothetical protein
MAITNSGYTQDTATWALTANQAAMTVGNITATSQALSGLTVNNYLSSSGGQRIKPTTSDGTWPADIGPNSNRYVQYTVTPGGTDNLVVTKIYLPLSFNTSGGGRAAISWSTDGTNFADLSSGTALASGVVPSETILTGLSIPVLNGQTFYLRVYPWSLSAGVRYLVSKNIRIAGTPQSTSTATWALTANQNATAGSDLSATAQALSGLSVNNYISSSGGQRVRSYPDSTWPAETEPNASRYLQYMVAPVAGKDMVVKAVSMALSFNSSSFVHAKIAWSSDGANFTTLIADTNLVAGSVPATISIAGFQIPIAGGSKFYLRVYPWSTILQPTTKFIVSKNVTVTAVTHPSTQVAFPGAEGGGSYARGGREGSVYYVTTLADSGPGSLRDAVSQSNRAILFNVSGTIQLNTPIVITKDYITIAGQTAPGDGICISQQYFGIRGSNIIVRYMRFRLGDVDSVTSDALSGGYATAGAATVKNVIIDHCSVSWSVDETASFYGIGNFTFQWCIISESLFNSVHTKGTPHGYGGLWGGQTSTFHHNLLASHSSRNPRLTGAPNSLRPDLEYVDYRNNVVYNWGIVNSTYGGEGGHYNMVNNYYKPGPATSGDTVSSRTNKRNRILNYITSVISQVDGSLYWGGNFYIDGNYVVGFPDVSADNWTNGVQPDNNPLADSMIAQAKMLTPYALPYVRTQTAEDAYVSVTDSAGAILPRRDPVDLRIIWETQNDTALYEGAGYPLAAVNYSVKSPSGIIDSQTDVGGWPTLTSTAAPRDTDNDGMPNWWEAKTNNNDADSLSVSANTYDIDRYTMLEKYLNAIESPDKQSVFNAVNATKTGIDTIQVNYTINWAKDLFTYGLFRSTDGTSFTQIAVTGSNINKTKYVLNDFNAPQAQLYYKIGSYRTDRTLDTVYSNTVAIDNQPEIPRADRKDVPPSDLSVLAEDGEGSLKVYPNPVSDRLMVRHPKAKEGAFITIYTNTGQLVATYRAKPGQTLTSVNMFHMSSGSYLLKFSNGQEQKTVGFVKY